MNDIPVGEIIDYGVDEIRYEEISPNSRSEICYRLSLSLYLISFLGGKCFFFHFVTLFYLCTSLYSRVYLLKQNVMMRYFSFSGVLDVDTTYFCFKYCGSGNSIEIAL